MNILTPTRAETTRDTRTQAAWQSSAENTGSPGVSRLELSISLAIFVFSFFYLCLFLSYCGVDADEGIILQGAQRILDGQVLYRDFFSFYTPGSYYLYALIFRLFGDSYAVAHTALACIGAWFSVITYLLARRVCSRQTSLLVTGLMTVTAIPWRFLTIHNWDSTFFACLALYCAVRWLESASAGWAFAAATFTSLTALFEQSKGAGLLLGLGVGFLIIALRENQPRLFARRQLVALACGLCLPFFLTLIYFSTQHAFSDMLSSWFWPLHHYSGANRVPYGFDNLTGEARHRIFDSAPLAMQLFAMLVFSSRTWIPFVPLIAVALLIWMIAGAWRGTSLTASGAYFVLVSATISGLLLSIVIARADYLHFIYLQPIFFLPLAWLLDGRGIRHPVALRVIPFIGFFVTMSLLAVAGQALISSRGTPVITRRGAVTMAKPDPVLAYVQANVAAGEKVLVYPYQSTYYFLTRTYSPTRFDFYQPGMHTEQQLQEMLEEFSAHPTAAVLYNPSFVMQLRKAWPNSPPSASVPDALAKYIESEYRSCASFGPEVQFMMRKDRDCPGGEGTAQPTR